MSGLDKNSTPTKRFLSTPKLSNSRFTFNSSARRDAFPNVRPGLSKSGLEIEDDSPQKHLPFKIGSANWKSPAQSVTVSIDDDNHDSDDLQARYSRREDGQNDHNDAYSSRPQVEDEMHIDDYPGPKRRKVMSLHYSKSDPIIASSSSSTNDQGLSDDDFPSNQLRASTIESDDFLPDSTTSRTPARFKMPSAAIESLEAPHSKASFRIPEAQSQGLTQMANMTLPDAFSPSRKRGKKEYVYKGAADTVRNWILEAASIESSNAPRQEETISVSAVSKDKGGRFALVTTEDAKQWLLIGQKGRPHSLHSSDVAAIQVDDQISIKGVATRWPLTLGMDSSAQEYQVAADWRIQK